MFSHLYFICPTDHLEPLINETYKGENYFVSTLGNSLVFDAETTRGLIDLIENKKVKKITFVLASDNSIIEDATEQKVFSEIEGIQEFYHRVQINRRNSEMLYKVKDHNPLIISYHLNEKIKELQTQTSVYLSSPLSINGKVYNRMNNTFDAIYTDLILGDLVSLN